MRRRLEELDAAKINAIYTHPLHAEGLATIVRLIRQLRSCGSMSDLYVFQQELLRQVLRVEEHRLACSRVVKRLARGERVPANAIELRAAGTPNDLATWELERDVCERIARQLRCVGDALAWRAFAYRRNFIVALSRNEPPGPMAGKQGLVAERAFIEEVWRQGYFAILHDLTSCLRIGDVTVFRSGELTVQEIKTSERRRSKEQEERIVEACEALRNATVPTPGTVGHLLVDLKVPYRTHLGALREALDLATQRTHQAIQIPGGRALVAVNLAAGFPADSDDESAAIVIEAFERAQRKAHIRDDDQITMTSIDQVGRFTVAPPWSIYPMTPEMCALLIADTAFFHVSMSGTRILGALEQHGVKGRWLQPLDASLQYHQPVLEVTRVDRRRGRISQMTMNPYELGRLLFELLDLGVWAASVALVLSREDLDQSSPWPYFSDEYRVWA